MTRDPSHDGLLSLEARIIELAGPLGRFQASVQGAIEVLGSRVLADAEPTHPGGKFFRIPPRVWWSVAGLFDDSTSQLMSRLVAPLSMLHRLAPTGPVASKLLRLNEQLVAEYMDYVTHLSQQQPALSEALLAQIHAAADDAWVPVRRKSDAAEASIASDDAISGWLEKEAQGRVGKFLRLADKTTLSQVFALRAVVTIDDSVAILMGIWAGARKSPRVAHEWERGITWSEGDHEISSEEDLTNARVWLFTQSSPLRNEELAPQLEAFTQWAFRTSETWPNFRSPDPDIYAALRDRVALVELEEGSSKEPENVPAWVKRAVQAGQLKTHTPHLKVTRKASTVEDIWAELDQMEGLSKFKAELKQIAAQVSHRQALLEKGAVPGSPELNLVLLGNPGTGKTTGARLYGRLLKTLGLLAAGHLVEVGRADLVGSHVGETAKRVSVAFAQAKGGVLFIDEAYSLARDHKDVFGMEAIDAITQLTEQMRGDLAVVVAGYSGLMAKFFDANPGLKGRFRDSILFPDISPEGLVRIIESRVQAEGLVLGEGTSQALDEKFASMARGEGFANAREARKLLSVMRERLALRYNADIAGVAPEVLLPEDVPLVGPGQFDEQRFERAQEALIGLVGISDVKQTVVARANQARLAHMVNQKGLVAPEVNPGHMVFLGNPGTGKTTVARFLGELYASIGLLASGHLVSRNRESLVGQYIGQTAPKVRAAIEESLDGVLFIDEAYALVNPVSPMDFGAEALATLIEGMERYRSRLLVVLAGYSEEMLGLLEMNPGLKGRISETVEFPDYSLDELREITQIMAAGMRYPVTDEAVDLLASRIYETRKSQGFANARDVRTLLEKAWAQVANRIVGGTSAKDGSWEAQIEISDVPHPAVKALVPVGFQMVNQ